MQESAVNLFYSYSHADELYRKDMEKFLTLLRSENLIREWCDRKMLAGQNIAEEIDNALNDADIIIFIISIDFLSSQACKEEWKLAKLKAKTKNKKLISIIARECPWLDFEDMKNYLALPTDGKPITEWSSKDAAWNNVYGEIKIVVVNFATSTTEN